MADVSVPNTFLDGTSIEADEFNANFTALLNWINTNAVRADGTIDFTALPSLPAADPTTDNQPARKKYVDTKAGGIVSRKTKSSGGTYASLAAGMTADTYTDANLWSATTISEVTDHWYRATLHVPILATNRSALNVFGFYQETRVGAGIFRDDAELTRGWISHDTEDDGLTLHLMVDRQATADASVDWDVRFRHSYNGGSTTAIRYNANDTWPMTFTIEDLGTGVA